jgi:hypothetical protein
MARKEQVKCDACGKLKQETNHWFVVSLSGNRISIAGRDYQDDASNFYDCCGEACVLRKVSELIVRCH